MLPEQQLAALRWENINRTRVRSRVGSPIDWIGEPFGSLIAASQTQEAAIGITEIFFRNPSWQIVTSLIAPPAHIMGSLVTPEERINFLYARLQERELLEKRMKEKYGSTTVPMQIGNMKPFELVLANFMEDGQFFFTMRDMDTGYETALMSLTILDRQTIWVSSIQHHVPHPASDATESQQQAYKNAGQRNHKLRRFIANHGGTQLVDGIPINTQTPGVEEALATGVVQLLSQFGLIDHSARLIIPTPEATPWGRPNALGIETTIWKSATRSLRTSPSDHVAFIENLVRHLHAIDPDEALERNEATQGIYEHIQYALSNEHVLPHIDGTDLPIYFLRLLAGDIDNDQQRTQAIEKINSLSFQGLDGYEAYESFTNLAEAIARQTNAYITQFHAYFTTFVSLPNYPYVIGRAIQVNDILQSPYANLITLGNERR